MQCRDLSTRILNSRLWPSVNKVLYLKPKVNHVGQVNHLLAYIPDCWHLRFLFTRYPYMSFMFQYGPSTEIGHTFLSALHQNSTNKIGEFEQKNGRWSVKTWKYNDTCVKVWIMREKDVGGRVGATHECGGLGGGWGGVGERVRGVSGGSFFWAGAAYTARSTRASHSVARRTVEAVMHCSTLLQVAHPGASTMRLLPPVRLDHHVHNADKTTSRGQHQRRLTRLNRQNIHQQYTLADILKGFRRQRTYIKSVGRSYIWKWMWQWSCLNLTLSPMITLINSSFIAHSSWITIDQIMWSTMNIEQ